MRERRRGKSKERVKWKGQGGIRGTRKEEVVQKCKKGVEIKAKERGNKEE